jgi:hypothetical protein
MAFSEELAERIRQGLARRKGIEEKKMFGGIGFRRKGWVLVAGLAMKGWVLVASEGVEADDELSGWVQRAVKFVGKLPGKQSRRSSLGSNCGRHSQFLERRPAR